MLQVTGSTGNTEDITTNTHSAVKVSLSDAVDTQFQHSCQYLDFHRVAGFLIEKSLAEVCTFSSQTDVCTKQMKPCCCE